MKNYIKKDIGGIDNIKYYVLLYANGAFLNQKLIKQAIKKLDQNKKFDSCVGVVNADMFTPIRAKIINKKKLGLKIKIILISIYRRIDLRK